MILELSGEFPVKLLCDVMRITRSSFYYWKRCLSHPSSRKRNLVSNIQLFLEYHLKYPSHGYRWLNAKIRLDTGLLFSDQYAHFYVKGIYYELTLYMDLWNNEIVSHALSSKRGDRMTYISGLKDLLELKKEHPEYKMILHSD